MLKLSIRFTAMHKFLQITPTFNSIILSRVSLEGRIADAQGKSTKHGMNTSIYIDYMSTDMTRSTRLSCESDIPLMRRFISTFC